jgi:hypothetical protein
MSRHTRSFPTVVTGFTCANCSGIRVLKSPGERGGGGGGEGGADQGTWGGGYGWVWMGGGTMGMMKNDG